MPLAHCGLLSPWGWRSVSMRLHKIHQCVYVLVFRYCYRTACTFVISKASLVASIPVHTMKVYGGTAPLILTFGMRCGWEIDLATQPLYSRGTKSHYACNKRVDDLQRRPGRFGEEMSYPCLESNHDRSVVQFVA
jgi:hypothetical protein